MTTGRRLLLQGIPTFQHNALSSCAHPCALLTYLDLRARLSLACPPARPPARMHECAHARAHVIIVIIIITINNNTIIIIVITTIITIIDTCYYYQGRKRARTRTYTRCTFCRPQTLLGANRFMRIMTSNFCTTFLA